MGGGDPLLSRDLHICFLYHQKKNKKKLFELVLSVRLYRSTNWQHYARQWTSAIALAHLTPRWMYSEPHWMNIVLIHPLAHVRVIYFRFIGR